MYEVAFAPSMTTEEIADRLKRSILLVLRLDLPLEAINNETNLYDLGLESLNVVQLLMEIETVFDVTIDVEDLSAELFTKFENCVAFIQRKLDERQ